MGKRQSNPHQSIYALICRDEVVAGPHYVKVGRSGDVGGRLSDLIIGSPLPWLEHLVIHLVPHVRAEAVERGILRMFKARKSRGEWFRFTLDDPADAAVLREGLSLAERWAVSPTVRTKRTD